MAPAQPLMDIDLDSKTHFTRKVAPDKERSFLTDNGKGLRCGSNSEDTIIQMQAPLDEQSNAPNCSQDIQVDIIGCTIKSDIISTEKEDPDATEYSSSFVDTTYDTENCSGLSEGEVESQFFGGNGFASAFDAFSGTFHMRKKKLTDHWRSFIRPLMWRCKWTELRIKELESQALKYTREVAAYEQTKLLGFNQFTCEESGSKSLPFSSQSYRKKAIKRRKRKKVEDTADITSYMSQHNLFSYLENKKSDPDGTSMADDYGNPVITDQNDDCNGKFGINNDWSLFEFRDGDNILEQVLWKIEMVHSRVHKLRSQIDIVMSQNVSRFSSSENLSLLAPCDGQTSSAHSPTFSAGNGDTISVGPICTPTKHISDSDNGDLVMPGSAISSYGEAIHVPDIIESTMGLLSAADVTLHHQPQIGDSCEDIVDNVLIHNEAAEAERHTFNRIANQPTEEHQEQEIGEQEESTNPSSIQTSEPLPLVKTEVPQEQSTLKSCLASEVHFPRNKRKRGERKAGSGGWSKRSSGEPDSQ